MKRRHQRIEADLGELRRPGRAAGVEQRRRPIARHRFRRRGAAARQKVAPEDMTRAAAGQRLGSERRLQESLLRIVESGARALADQRESSAIARSTSAGQRSRCA